MSEICKIILLGNGSVGKSSIVNRLVSDGFSRMYKQTVGLDFLEKQIHFDGAHRGKQLKLQVWDIGGQSINSDMLPKYIHGAEGILLCYDVTDRSSFMDIIEWLELASKSIQEEGKEKPVRIYILGNKIDLSHLRQVSLEEHESLINRQNLSGGYFVSAKSGENITRTFYKIAATKLNIHLTEYELAFTDKAITATITLDSEEPEETETLPKHIAEEIARIEKEDMEAERRAGQSGSNCGCGIS